MGFGVKHIPIKQIANPKGFQIGFDHMQAVDQALSVLKFLREGRITGQGYMPKGKFRLYLLICTHNSS